MSSPAVTAIIADAPIICEASVMRAIPKIYATADDDAMEINEYLCYLERKTGSFQEQLTKELKIYYGIFTEFRRILVQQNDIITNKYGGTPVFIPRYYDELNVNELFHAPHRSLIQC